MSSFNGMFTVPQPSPCDESLCCIFRILLFAESEKGNWNEISKCIMLNTRFGPNLAPPQRKNYFYTPGWHVPLAKGEISQVTFHRDFMTKCGRDLGFPTIVDFSSVEGCEHAKPTTHLNMQVQLNGGTVAEGSNSFPRS